MQTRDEIECLHNRWEFSQLSLVFSSGYANTVNVFYFHYKIISLYCKTVSEAVLNWCQILNHPYMKESNPKVWKGKENCLKAPKIIRRNQALDTREKRLHIDESVFEFSPYKILLNKSQAFVSLFRERSRIITSRVYILLYISQPMRVCVLCQSFKHL